MTWLSWLIDLFRAWLSVRAEIQQKQKSMWVRSSSKMLT
jgi:hypothetical protein